MQKRTFLGSAAAALAAIAVAARLRGVGEQTPERFEVVRHDAEWRAMLDPEAYSVLRRGRTERAGSSPLDREHRRGIFHCAGCNLAVFSSSAKFDSRTGWPSYTSAIGGAVGTKDELSLVGVQTEVHCRRCGGHLGHVFEDGPPPTGLRFCINGAALTFVPV